MMMMVNIYYSIYLINIMHTLNIFSLLRLVNVSERSRSL